MFMNGPHLTGYNFTGLQVRELRLGDRMAWVRIPVSGCQPCAARTRPCHSQGLWGGVALSASLSVRCHESSSPFSFFTADAEPTYRFFFFPPLSSL